MLGMDPTLKNVCTSAIWLALTSLKAGHLLCSTVTSNADSGGTHVGSHGGEGHERTVTVFVLFVDPQQALL